MILSSSLPSSPVPNINPSGVITPSSTASITITNGHFDDNSTTIISGGSCARIVANGLTSVREYAFVDCSEVYLAGKRTSGIYEIW